MNSKSILPRALRSASVGLVAWCALVAHAPAWATQGQHFGQYEATAAHIEHATAMAYDAQGWLWIADLDTLRIVAMDGDQRLQASFAWPKQSCVGGITHDADGQLWVTDHWNHRVFHVSRDGKILHATDDQTLLFPRGILHHSDEFWVADSGHGRIVVFNKASEVVRTFGENRLVDPRQICAAGENRWAVVDAGLSAVVVFDEQGEEVHRFGEWGWFPGLFSDPSSLAWHAGRYYIADRENQRVQVLDDRGEPLYRLGTHAILPREGEGKLHYPTLLAMHPDGERLAVAEPMDGRVQFFGLADGEKPAPDPTRPESVQPSPHYGPQWALGAGFLAIPEPETHRVRIFDLRLVPEQDPIEVTQVGGYGTDFGLFRNPGALWIGGDPLRLWVADDGNQRLVEVALDLDGKRPLAQTKRAARFIRALDWKAWNAEQPEATRLKETPAIQDFVWLDEKRLAILCRNNRVILVLDENWKEVARLGTRDQFPLFAPRALAWHAPSERLAIADEGSGAVWLTDLAVEEILMTGNQVLRRPCALEFTAAGELHVIDRLLNQRFRFDAKGELLGQDFSKGIGREELFGPTDIAIGPNDTDWILDHGNHRGMVFDAEGQWLRAFGSRLYTKPARLPHTQEPSTELPEDGVPPEDPSQDSTSDDD